MKSRKINSRLIVNSIGVFLILLGIVLFILTILLKDPTFTEKYEETLLWLSEFEEDVASIPNKGLVIIAILLLYVAKSVLPVPTPVVCVIAGMVFQTPFAVIINSCGFILTLTIKYVWGKHLGSGVIYKILHRYENVRPILEGDTIAKDGLLAVFRFIPIVPINTVSQIYGAMDYDYYKFIFLSVVGFLPRIVSYSLAGSHVYNPFSFAFSLPLIILFIITGFAMLGINGVIAFILRNKKLSHKDVQQ